MNNILLLVSLVAFALVPCSAFAARAAWINKKISALRLPPQNVFAAANAALPRKGPRPRVVLIGDSRISRWPRNSWEEPWEIVNRGIGGETTAQLSLRFQSDALALDPDAIVIESGVNDLVAASFMPADERGAVVRRTAEALLRLVEAGVASGAAVSVATIIPPAQPGMLRLLVWRKSLRILVAELNMSLRNLRWPARAVVVDFSQALGAIDDKTLPKTYRADAFHLNGLAYERLAKAVELATKDIIAAGAGQ
jgi:lysophospholipase L1-like esterase